jgi:hypothetical protein
MSALACSLAYPVETSHTRIVLSREADINCSPVGMNRTLDTEWSCPCSVFVFLYSFAGSQSLMVRSDEHVAMRQCQFSDPLARTHDVALWIKIHVRNGLCVAFDCPLKVAAFPIPDLDSRIFTGTREDGPCWVEGDAGNGCTVGREGVACWCAGKEGCGTRGRGRCACW